MYIYKTIAVDNQGDVDTLNVLYSQAWEYVSAVPNVVSAGRTNPSSGTVYFTLRKVKQA